MPSEPRKSIAIATAAGVLAAAAVAGWLAVRLHDATADPHWSAVGTAGILACAFCLWSLLSLAKVRRGSPLPAATVIRVAVALTSLAALVAVAFATRLTG